MARRLSIIAGQCLTRDRSGQAPSVPVKDELAYRSLVFEREAVNVEARTVEFSFSSNIELERWPGFIEVLDHAPEAVDLSRLQSGAPLLFNHDLDDYIGVVERAWITADGKGRCVVRFSENEDAEKVWRDVKAGILRNVSVGYRIQEVKLAEERENGTDVYRVTRWQPYEVSIVTVPADTSVGIGRAARSLFSKPSNQPKPKTVMNRDQMIAALRARGHTVADDISDADLTALFTRSLQPATPPAPQANAPAPSGVQVGTEHRAQGETAERERVRSILAAGREYNAPDLAQTAIEQGHSMDQFRTALLAHVDKRNKAITDGTSPIGLTDKEARSFSFLRLLRSMSDPTDKSAREAAKFELEACRAAADKMTHRAARGMVIPIDVMTQPVIGQRADTIVGSKTGAGYTNVSNGTVLTTLLQQSLIDMLRNRSVLMQLVTELSGLVGNVDIPKHLTGSTAVWIGEDEAAPKNDLTFGIVSLRPKTVSNRAEITRRLLLQDSLGVEALIRQDLARSLALEIDRAGLYGTNADNQPKGLRLYSINGGTWALANKPTFAELVAMETDIALDNADVPNMAYLSNAGFRGHAKTTRKFTDGNDGTIWEPGNSVNGYRTEITNMVTAGHVFFGNWADLLIGMWGGLDIVVDPYTHSDKGRIRITQFQDLDYTVRREESFALRTNA